MSGKELQQAAWELLAMLDTLPKERAETGDGVRYGNAAGERNVPAMKRLPLLRASEGGAILPAGTAEQRGETLLRTGTEVSLSSSDGMGESGSFDAEESGRTQLREQVFSPLRAEDVEELDRRFRLDSRRYNASPGRDY